MARKTESKTVRIKAQIMLGQSIAIGPGKADLLAAIARTGSIAAAGRELGFSYRRTRDMIDTLNACWKVPLVEGSRGGPHGGGTALTPTGAILLERYRALELALQNTAAEHSIQLLALLGPVDDPARP